jgi:ABC transporter substrate binding protein
MPMGSGSNRSIACARGRASWPSGGGDRSSWHRLGTRGKGATTTIPIVFSVATDPIAMGLVASLNRPGGNLTGVANLMVELGQKQLELLHELVPAITIMAVLINPNLPAAESQARDLQTAARKLALELHVMHASTERDLDAVFAKMVELRVGALAITADAFFLSRREQIIALAARHSLPATSPWREAAVAGGLMSYGTSDTEGYRQLGSSGCFRLERSPGETCTHWKAPPSHGTHPRLTLATPTRFVPNPASGIKCDIHCAQHYAVGQNHSKRQRSRGDT